MLNVDTVEQRLFGQNDRYKYSASHLTPQWKNSQATAYILHSPNITDRTKILKKQVHVGHEDYLISEYEMVRELNNYSTNYWIPEHVVDKYNIKVRRGQEPHYVRYVFVRGSDGHPYALYHDVYVYNIDQLAKGQIELKKLKSYNDQHVDNNIVQWLKLNRIRIKHQTNTARFECFDGRRYYIAMPNFSQFPIVSEYYSVLFHEVGHYVRFKKFNRFRNDDMPPFGSIPYAYEELIAELTSIMVCEKMNIDTDKNKHLSYLYEWLTVFHPKDRHSVFKKAAEDAKKVVDCLTFDGV